MASRDKDKYFRAVFLLISVAAWYACFEGVLHLFPALLPRAVWAPYQRERAISQARIRVLGNFEKIWSNDKVLGMKRPPYMVFEPDKKFYGDCSLSSKADPKMEDMQVGRLKYDRNGFRNYTVPDKAQVLVLGDSFAELPYIGRPWPEKLGEILGKSTYNTGVSRFGTIQEKLTYDLYGARMKPSVVVLAFYEGNDIEDIKDYEDYLKSGLTMIDLLMSQSKESVPYWKRSLRLLLAPRLVKYYLAGSPAVSASPGNTGWFPFQNKSGTFEMSFLPNRVKMLLRGRDEITKVKELETAKQSLKALNEECSKADTTFIVVYIPTKEHVYLPLVLSKMGRTDFNREMSIYIGEPRRGTDYALKVVSNSDALRDEMEAYCLNERIKFMDLTPRFIKAAYNSGPVYFLQDSHWNQQGSDLAAEIIAKYLRSLCPPERQAQPVCSGKNLR